MFTPRERLFSRRTILGGLVGAGVALADVIPFAPATARACGVFTRGPRVPALNRELTLIVFDPTTHLQHFIRELAFRDAKEPFGFVIPTPTEPTIGASASPFDSLISTFPFERQSSNSGIGLSGGGQGFGRGAGSGVTVKSAQDVGSFTATVLSATDVAAFTGWLRKEGFTPTERTTRWLDPYVRMKFHFVAMRYNPQPQPVAPALKAESFRVSFRTPLPYYPYAEPQAPADTKPNRRSMTTWLVATRNYAPVCLRTSTGGAELAWIRAFEEGRAHEDARKLVEKALFKSHRDLLPEGPLTVQVFQDSKAVRDGYGDVLFAPADEIVLSTEELEMLRPMLGVLDPSLLP